MVETAQELNETVVHVLEPLNDAVTPIISHQFAQVHKLAVSME